MTTCTHARDPIAAGAVSLLIPGLGQWLQRRRAAALYFGVDFHAAVLIAALVPEIRAYALAAAIAIGTWSVVDAALAARRVRSLN